MVGNQSHDTHFEETSRNSPINREIIIPIRAPGPEATKVLWSIVKVLKVELRLQRPGNTRAPTSKPELNWQLRNASFEWRKQSSEGCCGWSW